MARRGRPRKSGPRTKNGRVVRKTRLETEAEIVETAMAARLRRGIPAHLARSTGTLEGCLWAAHERTCDPDGGNCDKEVGISRDQYEAAVFYNIVRLDYLSAIDDRNSPQQPRSKPSSGDEDAHERFCNMARERWDAMREVVLEKQQVLGNTSNLFAALDGLERGHLMEFQLGDLREALNAIHKFRVNDRKKAA